MRAARVTSSISAPRRLAMPPIRSSAARRTSIVPPAAAAVAAARVVHAGERIQELEEEHEGGDERALGEALRPQRDHLGDQVEPVPLGFGDQRGDMGRVVHDVGVGEQDQVGGGVLDALLHSPEFAAPARRPWRAGDHGEACGRRRSGRPRAMSPVPSVLPSSTTDDMQRPGVVLGQQRAERRLDALRPRRGRGSRRPPAAQPAGCAGASTGPACQNRPWASSR